jgi:hypothetical protein
MHSELSFDVSGEWFRWSRYDLRDGIIIPARVEDPFGPQRYDPWHQYRANVGKYRTVEQPYIALLELQRQLEKAEASGLRPVHADLHEVPTEESVVGPQNEADELILNWCNDHGLLGLVSTLCNSICFAPEVLPLPPHESTRVVKQEMHVRIGGAWESVLDVDTVIETTSKRADAAARREAKQRTRPGVTWFNRASSVYEWKPLNWIRRFFPFFSPQVVENAFRPPCPNEEGFWADYGEPVSDFMLWCRLFTRAVEHLSGWKGGPLDSDNDYMDIERPFRTLNGLAQGAAPSFHLKIGRGAIDESRRTAGLLSSYALMFLWDRMDERRSIRCGNCGGYFVSNEKRAQYCRRACRNTAQSRRYRGKNNDPESASFVET